MAEVKVATEVAGRVCALNVDVGARVNQGDDIALIEAMKMEIPVTATASGTVKSVLVKMDEMITEGQAVMVIEG